MPLASFPDERWNAAASRLLESLRMGHPADLDAELEHLLRCFVRSKAQRFSRQLGVRAMGIDPDDVAQRVLLQLLERPPDREEASPPLRRLLNWAATVTRNYLYDVTSRHAERLSAPGLDDWGEGGDRRDSGVMEGRYAARQALLRMRPAVAQHYPAGLPLLDLLLEAPHATSQELSQRLDTSAANIDQMRHRIRRVLRRELSDDRAPRRMR